jgi:hypothetical protein
MIDNLQDVPAVSRLFTSISVYDYEHISLNYNFWSLVHHLDLTDALKEAIYNGSFWLSPQGF